VVSEVPKSLVTKEDACFEWYPGVGYFAPKGFAEASANGTRGHNLDLAIDLARRNYNLYYDSVTDPKAKCSISHALGLSLRRKFIATQALDDVSLLQEMYEYEAPALTLLDASITSGRSSQTFSVMDPWFADLDFSRCLVELLHEPSENSMREMMANQTRMFAICVAPEIDRILNGHYPNSNDRMLLDRSFRLKLEGLITFLRYAIDSKFLNFANEICPEIEKFLKVIFSPSGNPLFGWAVHFKVRFCGLKSHMLEIDGKQDEAEAFIDAVIEGQTDPRYVLLWTGKVWWAGEKGNIEEALKLAEKVCELFHRDNQPPLAVRIICMLQDRLISCGFADNLPDHVSVDSHPHVMWAMKHAGVELKKDDNSALKQTIGKTQRTIRCFECKQYLTKIMRCSGCNLAVYCSRECQKKNWKVHRPGCKTEQEK
jgi:hypothetical protein